MQCETRVTEASGTQRLTTVVLDRSSWLKRPVAIFTTGSAVREPERLAPAAILARPEGEPPGQGTAVPQRLTVKTRFGCHVLDCKIFCPMAELQC